MSEPLTPAAHRPTSRALHLAVVSGLILIAVVAIFGQLANASFIYYDDPQFVTGNPHVQGGLTVGGIRWAFTSLHGFYFPLTWLSHMTDQTLWGAWAGGHHLTSILLHAAATLLLLLFLWRATAAPWQSALVAGLFAIHPMHVESVAWVAERKDVLSAFFLFLALVLYGRYTERPSVGRNMEVTAALLLGLMSKGMLVTAPALLLLLDVWPLERIDLPQARGRPGFTAWVKALWPLVREKGPLWALSALFCILTILGQKELGAFVEVKHLPLWDRVVNATDAVGLYVAKTLVPVHLAIHYPLNVAAIPSWRPILTALLAIGFTALALSRLRKWPFLAVGWGWFLVSVLPVIGLVQIGGAAMADRYSYIPCVGLYLIIAWSAGTLAKARPNWRPALSAALALWLAALAFTAWQQAGTWKNSESVFRHALAVTTDNDRIHHNLGLALADEGRTKEAIQEYVAALKIDPFNAKTWTALGNAYLNEGRLSEARASYLQALGLRPLEADLHRSLARVAWKQGDLATCAAEMEAALSAAPGTAGDRVIFGRVLAAQGESEPARREFEAALAQDPRDAAALCGLGALSLQMGDRPAALAHYQSALQAAPASVEALAGLAEAMMADPAAGAREREQALALARRAWALSKERSPEALDALLRTLDAADLREEAARLRARYRPLHTQIPAPLDRPTGPGGPGTGQERP